MLSSEQGKRLDRPEVVQDLGDYSLISDPIDASAWTRLAVESVKNYPVRSTNWFHRAVVLSGGRDARCLVNYGLSLENLGSLTQAESIYRDVLVLIPREPKAIARLLGLLIERQSTREIVEIITDDLSIANLDGNTKWTLGLHVSRLKGAETAGLILLNSAVASPGIWVEPALGVLVRLYQPQADSSIEISLTAKKRLLFVPDDDIAMGYIAEACGKKSHNVRSAAWFCQRAVTVPANTSYRIAAIESACKAKWPRHAIAQLLPEFKKRPTDQSILERIIEYYPQCDWQDYCVGWARKVLATDPEEPHVWDALLRLFKDIEMFDDADNAWTKAITKFPSVKILHYNRGIAQYDRNNQKIARVSIRRAAILDPQYTKALNGIGLTYGAEEDNQNAIYWTRRAKVVAPYEGTYDLNLGAYYRTQKRFAESLRFLDKAAASAADEGIRASAAFNAGMARIMLGETEVGFKQVEARWATPNFPSPRRAIFKKIWPGPTERPNARLIAFMEQGLGDEIMYAWYISYLQQDTDRLVVDCDRRMVDIFSRSFPGVEFVPRSARGDPALRDPDLHWKVPIGHVPQYYTAETKSIALSMPREYTEVVPKKTGGYIKPCPKKIKYWKDSLNKKYGTRPLVAVSWRSKIHNRLRDQQYMNIEEISQTITEGSVVVNLQYSVTEEEIVIWKREAKKNNFLFEPMSGVDLTNDLDDVFATLSIVDCTVSTLISLAWMSGSVGTPTLVFRTSWEGRIWHQQGFDFVPWQPSMRVFFRTPRESWEGPIRSLRSTLSNLIKKKT